MNHIYDDPYTESSSDREENHEKSGKNHLVQKTVQYSNLKTIKIKFPDDVEEHSRRNKSPISHGSSPQRRIRNGRSPSWGTRNTTDAKKRRLSRRESFFTNLIEKPKGKRKTLNPFAIGRSGAFQSCPEFSDNSRQRIKTHII